MIYFKLTIEKSAHAKVTNVLTSFGTNLWTISNVTETTNCEANSCYCMKGYKWNDTVCQTQNCCGNSTCTFTSPAHCVSVSTIKIQGSVHLDPQTFGGCLATKTNDLYIKCNENVTVKMKTTFSTINGFEALTIQNYTVGSVIANFQMVFVSSVTSQDLITKSQAVIASLGASMILETTGVVQIHMPPNPVKYDSNDTVSCTSQDDLGTDPIWTLQQPGGVNTIYNGTQATVILGHRETTVSLNDITELWHGTYKCAYIINNGSLIITHQANGLMDVAVVPDISITINPQFPRCKDSLSLLPVQINCQAAQIGYTYNVSWTSDITSALTPVTQSKYSMNGSTGGVWGKTTSQCVLQDLYAVLQKSLIVDIGLGLLEKNGAIVFSELQRSTNNSALIDSASNINATVEVLSNMQNKLKTMQNSSAVSDFLSSSSNILNTTEGSWKNNNGNTEDNTTLAERYLESVEELIKKTTFAINQTTPNVVVNTCNESNCRNSVFNVSVTLGDSYNGNVTTTGFQKLHNLLPSPSNAKPNSIVVSTTTGTQLPSSVEITIDFVLISPRPRNVLIKCVAWNNNTGQWSPDGCRWQGASSPGLCVCQHLSSFAILMSKEPIEIDGASQITYAGLGVSVICLLISLMIEITVWSTVVKTNTLYLRHTAHFNISLCLLIADCCFLASSINQIPAIWCQIFTVLKHFCYLAMFFWMLCLSITLLHQAVYLFHNVSKTSYLRFSLVLGYACPFLIVFITFIINDTGAEGSYYSSDGCWLVYKGLLQGSIYTFIIPVGIIIFINTFSMLVVIMKLLDHPKSTDKSCDKEKNAAKTVMRTVILLTPIFGVTWILGFVVMILDLTTGPIAFAVNYAFILLNAFQGFFILLTTCIGDRMVRETVLSRFRKKAPASFSESTTKMDSSLKK
ncbi:adhesion G-protein coupled receptor F3 [Betta splendens]|uniref:Adhesion G-protein coupled receptor F3 n=1 Tax=Betta splendens TaxID=158456 RepID=A0A9W2XIX9_BETSP|nr:adhesion G-protein coupled receptor F3 [Betta splendens]